MEDTKKETLTTETPEVVVKEEEKKDGGEKSYTQKDLDAVAGKVRAEVKAQLDKEYTERIGKEREEAERMALLSREEKDKELQSKRMKELDEKERSLILKENKLLGKEKLQELGLDSELIDLVNSENQEDMFLKIDKIAETIKRGISSGVEEQLKGTPPKDFGSSKPTGGQKPVVTSF